MFNQRRLDFAQFDAEPAHFHLLIHSAQKFDGAVGQIARQIACSVQPGARCVAEWIGHEFLGGDFGPVEIPTSQTVAPDTQLAGSAQRNRIEIAIQQIDLRVGDGMTDWQFPPAPLLHPGGWLTIWLIGRGDDRRFSWAVGVDQADAVAAQFPPRFVSFRRRLIAADNHQAERFRQSLFRAGQFRYPLAPIRRRQIKRG
ncbi:MAG: hypothetical protein HONDAALG_02420 [Gammaproteobacteria bacterium]|nr:hypothetical protein [Gammaproteobacteria bacterium]